MANIYTGQSELTINLDTKVDLTNANTAIINYIKPNKVKGSWSAIITDTTNGIITYEIQSPDTIDIAGFWVFYAEINYNNGGVAYGNSVRLYVGEKGTM